MKLLHIIFLFLAFAMAKILILQEFENVPTIVFPTFDEPDVTFRDTSGGCGSFIDCTEYVGAVLFNIGAGVIYIVLLIVELIRYLFDFIGLLLSVTIDDIPGAPFWVNLFIVGMPLAAMALILFRLFRKGASNA